MTSLEEIYEKIDEEKVKIERAYKDKKLYFKEFIDNIPSLGCELSLKRFKDRFVNKNCDDLICIKDTMDLYNQLMLDNKYYKTLRLETTNLISAIQLFNISLYGQKIINIVKKQNYDGKDEYIGSLQGIRRIDPAVVKSITETPNLIYLTNHKLVQDRGYVLSYVLGRKENDKLELPSCDIKVNKKGIPINMFYSGHCTILWNTNKKPYLNILIKKKDFLHIFYLIGNSERIYS